MKRILLLALATLALTACSGDELYELQVGGRRIRVEVADTPESRARGLMFRDELAEERGMLFAFPEEEVRAFYMRNTSIPLSIAYIDARLVIREIYDMEPFSEESVFSTVPVKYALEVNQGAFDAWNVRTGDRVVPSAELAERLGTR